MNLDISSFFTFAIFITKKNNDISKKDYIEFRHGNGCYSVAGRNGKKQDIVLAPPCAEEHTLIHEVRLSS